MTEVKSAVRALKLFEAFATAGEPMSLSRIASHLEMPTSSCLLLIRTLVANGYLSGTGRRQQYYPTRRLHEITTKIVQRDPLMKRVEPYLEEIRDRTGETVSFSTLEGEDVVIMGVAESRQMLRASFPVGTVRPPHVLASGKALLGALEAGARHALIQRLNLKPATPLTVTDAAALEAQVEQGRARGYYTGFGDGILELGTLAVCVAVDAKPYSIGVSGPRSRIEPNEAEIVAVAHAVGARMSRELSGG
jgi:DNA-binding IclR family transcriptional regulator